MIKMKSLDMIRVVERLEAIILPGLRIMVTCPDKDIALEMQTLLTDVEQFVDDFNETDGVSEELWNRCRALIDRVHDSAKYIDL